MSLGVARRTVSAVFGPTSARRSAFGVARILQPRAANAWVDGGSLVRPTRGSTVDGGHLLPPLRKIKMRKLKHLSLEVLRPAFAFALGPLPARGGALGSYTSQRRIWMPRELICTDY